MIYVGTDIVEVDRIKALIDRWPAKFIKRIFTPDEIAYCERQAAPGIHFAGRFAAKEAVKKALYAAGEVTPIFFRQIQVGRTPQGVPLVRLAGLGQGALQVSISHTGRHAIATAILETDD